MATEVPECGSWARHKLEFLRKYLSAYTTILKEYNFTFEYIDAFAGPGEHRIKGTGGGLAPGEKEFLQGSPQIALNVQYPFERYHFIELDPERREMLWDLKRNCELGSRITIIPRDCRDWLEAHFYNVNKWQRRRAIVFLDPFGMQVDWSTLECLAATKAAEVFINFPAWMGIQRLIPRDHRKLTDERIQMLDGYFGTHDWYDVMYTSQQQPTLFGTTHESTTKDGTTRELVSWYRNRLKSLFGFATKAIVVSSDKHDLYCLIHAGPNKAGHDIANDIIRSTFRNVID